MKVASKYALAAGWILAGLAGPACSHGAVPATEAKAEEPAMKQTAIAVTVPDAGWRLRVEQVLERSDEVWVLARVWRKPGAAAQVIRKLEAEVPVAVPDKPVRVFVAGKTWAWANQEPCEFVASLAEVVRRAGDARVLYAAKPEGRAKEAK